MCEKRGQIEIGAVEGALGVNPGISVSQGAAEGRLPCPLLSQHCTWSCLWRVLSKCLKTKLMSAETLDLVISNDCFQPERWSPDVIEQYTHG